MNFHKTIGFLAAFLLMVGLGVPDSFAQTINISASSTSLSDGETDPVTVTVTLTVTGGGAATSANLTLTQTNSDDSSPFTGTNIVDGFASRTSSPNVSLTDGDGEVDNHTIEFSFTDASNTAAQGDADAVDDKVTLVATWNHDNDVDTDPITSNTVTININDTAAMLADNAEDASGFRVFLTSPGDGAWTGVGKHKVKVQIQRLDGPSSQWGNYSSIEVGLYNNDTDTGHDDKGVREDAAVPIYQLTVSDAVSYTDEDNTTVNVHQLSDLVFATMKTDTLISVATNSISGTDPIITPVGDVSQVAYKRRTRSGRYDILEFRLSIPETDDADDLSKVYAVVQFNGIADLEIESRDTETLIYEGGGFSDVVGDGNLIKIDRDAPAADIVGSLSVEIGKKGKDKTTAGASVYAGIGKTIVTNASINGAFRESKVVVQIVAPTGIMLGDPSVEVIADGAALEGYKNTVTASDIFSTGNALRDSVEVAEDALRRKYTKADPRDDDDFRKNDTIPADDLDVQVRVQVVDKANNATTQGDLSSMFKLDCKRPVVTILYPKPSVADSATFTAKVTDSYTFLGEGEETQNLKPLNFEVHEAVKRGWIIIGVVGKTGGTGPDTLNVGAFDGEAEDDGDDNTVDGYDLITLDLKNPHKIPHDVEANQNKNKKPHLDPGAPGLNADVTVVVFDKADNKGSAKPDGGQPFFDSKDPEISPNKFFPRADALENNKIGGPEGTQHPVFRVDEKVDSILVRYEGGEGVLDVGLGGAAATAKAPNQSIRVKFLGDQGLHEGENYDLQVYVRDLAGHVTLSELQEGLTFENDLTNPQAGAFKIYTHVRNNKLAKGKQADSDATMPYGVTDGKIANGQMDSVVANQALRLTVIAVDGTNDKITAITYAKEGAKVVAMDSDGNLVPSATFWGGGVTDNKDGSATLNSDGWTIGERNLFMMSKEAVGPLTIAVKDMTADGVVNFMDTKEGITVDAADFRKFMLTPMEDGEEASEVWGDFDLEVTPVDAYGNASLKTFNDQTPGTANANKADSLNILDTRLNKVFLARAKNTAKKYNNIDVDFSSTLTEDLPLSWTLSEAGQSFPLIALDRPGKSALVRVRVDNTFIDDTDTRSRNLSSDISIKINQPLDVSITLWGPNGEDWTDESDLTLPAGGAEVTFRAQGFGEGDMVTFTVDGEAQDAVEADASGYAGQPVTLSGSGTVTVKAASGSNSAEESYDYAEAPAEEGRKAYVDADGNAVYLISDTDMTVGVDDFLALVAAYGSSEGDDNYNVQADINDDGTVDINDFLAFITSYGKTAAVSGKPIVLLPGINENAEFSLSLGSERVIAGELVAVDVSLANVEALIGYGFTLNYETDKFEFVSVAPADEDLLKSTGGDTPLFHHIVADGQVAIANGIVNGTAVSGGGDIVRFVFRVLYEFGDNARFEIADGLVFDPSQLQNPAVVAGVLELQSTPKEFALHQNFPNPFNPDTTIKYDLAESADVTLQIYNVLGQVVRTMVASEAQNAGRYQIRWNGMDDRGVSVSSGIYFYRISAGEFQNVRKLMLLK